MSHFGDPRTEQHKEKKHPSARFPSVGSVPYIRGRNGTLMTSHQWLLSSFDLGL